MSFNQEKALVGAFSVIVKTDCGTDGALHSTNNVCLQRLGGTPLVALSPLWLLCTGVWSVSEVLASRTTGRYTDTDIICRILYKVGHFWIS